MIFMIDRFSAMLAFIGFLLVIAKFITRRLNPRKTDSMLMKLHKPTAYLTVLAGTIHMVCSTRFFATTSIWIYVFGTISIISMILATVMFRLSRSHPGKWLIWHRAFSAIAAITLALHFI